MMFTCVSLHVIQWTFEPVEISSGKVVPDIWCSQELAQQIRGHSNMTFVPKMRLSGHEIPTKHF